MTGVRLSTIGRKYCDACRGLLGQDEIAKAAGDYNQLCSKCYKEYQHIISWNKVWDGRKWVEK
jgi:hypothetical protein